MDNLPRQLSIKETAKIFNIPAWTLRAYISKRLIPHRRIGRRIYIPTEKFQQWLSKGDVEPKEKGDDICKTS